MKIHCFYFFYCPPILPLQKKIIFCLSAFRIIFNIRNFCHLLFITTTSPNYQLLYIFYQSDRFNCFFSVLFALLQEFLSTPPIQPVRFCCLWRCKNSIFFIGVLQCLWYVISNRSPRLDFKTFSSLLRGWLTLLVAFIQFLQFSPLLMKIFKLFQMFDTYRIFPPNKTTSWIVSLTTSLASSLIWSSLYNKQL